LAESVAAPGNAKATLAWRELAKALVEYRRGMFASAIEWTQRTLDSGARQDLPGWSHERERNRAAAAYLVQAMAYQQSRQTGPAHAALAKAVEIVETQLPSLESGDLGREWPDWLIAHILLREASGLIEGVTSAQK